MVLWSIPFTSGWMHTLLLCWSWSVRTLVQRWSWLNIGSSAVRKPNFRGLLGSITKSSFAVPPPTICPRIGFCDLELWTVTFLGQTKPHCFLCYSPIADPVPSPRGPISPYCYNANKPRWCSRRSFQVPRQCSRCRFSSHPVMGCRPLDNWTTLSRFSPPATAERNKVLQQSRSQ